MTAVARTVAVVREVSAALAQCELTHVDRAPIDMALARDQHRAYCDTLARMGCEIVALPAQDALPDSVFVEDVALMLDEVAIGTRPGAASRRAEVDSVLPTLAAERDVLRLEAPGTLDGGDVLRLGRTLYVGQSSRSSEAGVAQLRSLVAPFGYAVVSVPIRGCLHLKSAVTQVAPDTLLVQPAWVDATAFGAWRHILVDPSEEHAANALMIGGAVLYPAAFPRTRARLEAAGIEVHAVDVSELQKAEGAVTCCSLVFRARAGSADG